VLGSVLLVTAAVGGWQLTSGDQPQPGSTATPAVSPAPPVLDHEDDYSAPAEELIDHLDHLDLDRVPPETLRQLEAMVAEREAVASGLWSVYGPALFRDDGPLPPRFRSLDAYELAYVLMAARADQLATSVATHGSLEAARPVVGPEHEQVEVRQADDCVTVAFADDPFARVGPQGPGSLQQRLEQRVTVGLAGEPACDGAPLSLSPGAQVALSR
jgi:hypothetical protein